MTEGTRRSGAGVARRSIVAAGLALLTAGLVGLGVFVLGRVADTPALAMGLTVAWLGVMLAAAVLVLRRRRGLLVPVAGGYLLAAAATGVLVGLPTLVSRTVNDADVPAAPAEAAATGGAGAGSGAGSAAGAGSGAGAGSAGGPAAQPATAVEIGRAELVGIDHRATGTARLIRLADQSLLVRLDRIDVQPGPDYYVHLVPGAGQRAPGDGTRLARLKGNRGSQSYPVPADRRVATPATVLIWCRTFNTPIANATIG